jgi:uncharacterized membrane protein YccF (DUF307 family)
VQKEANYFHEMIMDPTGSHIIQTTYVHPAAQLVSSTATTLAVAPLPLIFLGVQLSTWQMIISCLAGLTVIGSWIYDRFIKDHIALHRLHKKNQRHKCTALPIKDDLNS